MSFSPLLQQLVEALTCLPGVGQKSAQRMALHLLQRDRQRALTLAQRLTSAVEEIGQCQRCRNLTEEPVCGICRQANRDETLLCVVETPGDVLAIEQSGHYRGFYFLLHGHLSPIDGIGPETIGADLLLERLQAGTVQELIIATGTTVEGEATAYYLAQLAGEAGVATTRIAHGVPMGGDLEYVDGNTLGLALKGRRAFDGDGA